MDTKKFEVEVACRERVIYEIDAPDRQTAERVATERWRRGDASDLAGYSACQLDSVTASEAADPRQQSEDEELALRFIRERERLLRQIAGNLLEPSANDAISAEHVAADLGWTRKSTPERATPDTVRAAKALERLCRARRLVCFERQRVRAGERGEIRLYCTPDHLENLSAAVDGLAKGTAR